MKTAGGSAQGPRIPYRHLAGWSIAIAPAFIVAAVQLAIIIEWLRRQVSTLEFVQRALPGRTSLGPIHSRLTLWATGTILFLAVGFALWVAWSYQARANLRAGGGPPGCNPFLVAGSWATGLLLSLPIISMWLLWQHSEPYEPEAGRGRLRTTPVLWLWYATFAATMVLVLLAFRDVPLEGATPEQLIRRNNLLVPACLAGIGTAALTIVLIIRIEGRVQLKTEGGGWRSWTHLESGRRTEDSGN